MQNLVVYCADIGSVAAGNFGWARRPIDSVTETGTDIQEFADRVAWDLTEDRPVALGLECPLFVPLPDDPTHLAKARRGEGRRPWSAGAGPGALAMGITESAWILRRIRSAVQPEVKASLDWSEFESRRKGLFLWEAFVSATAKGTSHTGDAVIGIDTFIAGLPDIVGINAIPAESVISLIGLALLRTDWTTDPQVLSQGCVVIKA